MNKWWLLIVLLLPIQLFAAYERNTARPVNEVVYGTVDSVRYITHQEVQQYNQQSGWTTLLGAVVGGVIGNQFGKGTGREVATAVGAMTGAAVAQQRRDQVSVKEYRLVELLIVTDDNRWIDVIQDVDQRMLFSSGDTVRILYFDDGVRVDLAM
ncbi:glycine zipper 2TM domain-containing protein [Thaumasiovibrio sp. DFM-14]|uniref:glycine zipper 2TM domain-containing protein n=1 Tax=Thaumasiovibrio sp. DFM-14 TaxID=3384792 RepID=UPI0039A0E98B